MSSNSATSNRWTWPIFFVASPVWIPPVMALSARVPVSSCGARPVMRPCCWWTGCACGPPLSAVRPGNICRRPCWSGSRWFVGRGLLYGADAVGGVVQLFTRDDGSWLDLGAGSFGTMNAGAGVRRTGRYPIYPGSIASAPMASSCAKQRGARLRQHCRHCQISHLLWRSW